MTRPENAIPPYINGRFVDMERPQLTFSCQNPAKPSDILSFMCWSNDFIDDIINGLKAAQKNFALLSLQERLVYVQHFINCIRENSEEIKSQMMLELARSRVTVDEEWRLCEALFAEFPKFCTDALEERANSAGWCFTPAPVGLVLISSTVSLPVYTILAALLPSLAAGNAVTMKPSSHCPLSSSVIASCIHQAELPPGLVQVVYGEFEVFRRLILTHEFDVVFYTGGEEMREQIRKDLFNYPKTRLVLCHAGKNAAIVTGRGSFEDAAQKILYGAFADAGQRVESTGLVFVQEKRAQEFMDKIVRLVKAFPIGAKEDLANATKLVMGPLCSADARERYLRFQGIAYREALETLRWGKNIDNIGNGYFVSPGVHVVDIKKVVKSVYVSTPFMGPDLAVVPYTELEEVTATIDKLNAGHIVSVHTDAEDDVRSVRKLSQVPCVYWNSPTTELVPVLPKYTKGHPDIAIFNGLCFLFSTVFSKTLMLGKNRATQTLFAFLLIFCANFFSNFSTARADYRSSVEGNEVVKGKFYPKAKRFQLAVNGGTIMNQPFIRTFVVQASATYHFNEWHAINFDGLFGFSGDTVERECIENFMYSPERAPAYSGVSGNLCGSADAFPPTTPSSDSETMPPIIANDGNLKTQADKDKAWKEEKMRRGPYVRRPAYMPIRQIKQVFSANYQWTPVYGKALWFLSFVGYMDVYTSLGLGAAMSDYYPRKETTACFNYYNDPSSGETQCPISEDTKDEKGVAVRPYGGTSDPNGYGKTGRPTPLVQVSPVGILGLGTRFYVGRMMSKGTTPGAEFILNVELKNFSLIGSDPNKDSGFMNFFALWGGVGVLF